MGAKVDLPSGQGSWVFKIHGQIYDYSGPLHLAPRAPRSYCQLYILDTAQIAAERLGHPANSKCNSDVMRSLSALIHRVNSFARSFKMMDEVLRPGFNPIHHGGPFTQQFIADAWVMTEQNRFNYIRTHQADLRADTYQSILDFISSDYGSNGPPGKRIILPARIKGSPRSMLQDCQEAMTIAKYGKPDFFITFTCNPKWREIEESLQPGQTATDRPDMIARVYKCKFATLMELLLTKHAFGRVVSYVSVFEWQKRGLPHTHSFLSWITT
ncbi:unnamed protein product [Cylicocyclus nassatus]|uniref:Helitron helicase-like domain-containing protein n=1 Tax=Cylicocyclus nassatus TaxID=53992 RepID=A0AA36DNX9_CYLNA|nr:unnamed protein product [Cylicocyclus nassatus]